VNHLVRFFEKLSGLVPPYMSHSLVLGKRYISREHIPYNPVNEMSAITEWLEEKGITMKTLEMLDPTLRGTKQITLDNYGISNCKGIQTKLPLGKGGA